MNAEQQLEKAILFHERDPKKMKTRKKFQNLFLILHPNYW